MSADGTPDPARLAAIDQQLAEIGDRLDRYARAIMRGDVAVAIVADALAIVVLVYRPRIYHWELAVVLFVAGLLAAASFTQGLMLRSYRAEISELRVRGHGH